MKTKKYFVFSLYVKESTSSFYTGIKQQPSNDNFENVIFERLPKSIKTKTLDLFQRNKLDIVYDGTNLTKYDAMKLKKSMISQTKQPRYSSVQIRTDVKQQLLDYCNKKGLKMGKFIESIFLVAVSGSGTDV